MSAVSPRSQECGDEAQEKMNEVKNVAGTGQTDARIPRKRKQGSVQHRKEKRFVLEGDKEVNVEIRNVRALSLQPDPESFEVHARQQWRGRIGGKL